MMTSDERFALVWQKVERANKHIADLETATIAFCKTGPVEIGIKRDDQTKRPIHFVTSVPAVPHEIPIYLGDAIHSLRVALDHLAQQLYLVGSRATTYSKKTAFPFAESADKFKKAVKSNVVIGMKPEVIDQFRAIEPYKDGQGTDLWVLHELNNIDKHRAIVAVGARYIAVNVGGASLLDHFSAEVREMWQGITLPDLHLKPKDELCPLKAGDELFIDLPEAEFRPRQFTFDVALYEPDVVKPGPIIEIVRRLSEAVSRTITLFKPFLS